MTLHSQVSKILERGVSGKSLGDQLTGTPKPKPRVSLARENPKEGGGKVQVRTNRNWIRG